jgi:hypothetical protein
MLSGAKAFEISDIQEDEPEAALSRRSACNSACKHLAENRWKEFSAGTSKTENPEESWAK